MNEQDLISIEAMGPMVADVGFARASISFRQLDQALNANAMVTLDLPIVYSETETIEQVHQKIVAAALRTLRGLTEIAEANSPSDLLLKRVPAPGLQVEFVSANQSTEPE